MSSKKSPSPSDRIIGESKKQDIEQDVALMDVKEAVKAAAPRYVGENINTDKAERLVQGALHLTPHLSKRLAAGFVLSMPLFQKSVLLSRRAA
jgi:hypothetical protein